MKSIPASRILVIVVALLTFLVPGCVVNGRWMDLTAEQAALRVNPPGNGEPRFQALKPAPDGVLAVFENVADHPNEPGRVEAGYAFVTRELFGWTVVEGGSMSDTPTHGVLVSVTPPDHKSDRTILIGKVVNPRVSRVRAGFSAGQQREDAMVNGLFGMVAIANSSLCWLELIDAGGQRIELFDLNDRGGSLPALLHGDVDRALEECPREGNS